jgi:hypothetical protein
MNSDSTVKQETCPSTKQHVAIAASDISSLALLDE